MGKSITVYTCVPRHPTHKSSQKIGWHEKLLDGDRLELRANMNELEAIISIYQWTSPFHVSFWMSWKSTANDSASTDLSSGITIDIARIYHANEIF